MKKIGANAILFVTPEFGFSFEDICSQLHVEHFCILHTHDHIGKIIARTVTVLSLGTVYRQRIIIILGVSYKTSPPIPSHWYVSRTADLLVSILYYICIYFIRFYRHNYGKGKFQNAKTFTSNIRLIKCRNK